MTRRTGVVVAAGLLLAVLLAGVVSSWASDAPDGLEQVATEQGMGAEETERDAAFRDYTTAGVEDDGWSRGIAGVAGVGVTFALFAGVTLLLRRRTSASPGSADSAASTSAASTSSPAEPPASRR
jgi:hypothetical protein